MPTPVGHSLAAVAVQLASGQKLARKESLSLLFVVAIASLPDLDFVPGYIIGDPRAFHWGPAHSIFAALLVGAIVGLIRRRYGAAFAGAFMLVVGVYLSHLLLDLLLGPGNGPSFGLQVFWPVSRDRWMMPFALFKMAPETIKSLGPVETLFTRGILPVVARELVVLVPVLIAVLVARWFRAGKVVAGREVAERKAV